jgi:chromate transporter
MNSKHPTFKEALKVWIKIAAYSFGGPAGQISVMHKLLVEEKKWISEKRFLHAMNYCMLLPGPEAQQLATYTGWLLHKTKGGLTAGLLFILPGFVSILVLSILYAAYYDVAIVQAIFFGIKPAVLAIVIGAVIKIGKKSLKNALMYSIAIVSFIAIFFFNIPFPLIILFAGITGAILTKLFYAQSPNSENKIDLTIEEDEVELYTEKPNFFRALKKVSFWVIVWFVPIVIVFLIFGKDSVFVQESLFFSKAALVTFGGAYSVLAYIAQKAVEDYGWLQPGEMLDGIGMAETTPGPLIQVVQFVAFMGAFRLAGDMNPMWAGLFASVLITWVTFAPCFLFVFVGAPYIEYLRGNKYLTDALNGVTAAVTGVILNLGIWFSINTLFKVVNEENFGWLRLILPDLSSIDYASVGITVLSFFIYFVLKWDMLKTILACVVAGVLWNFIV